MSTHDQLTTHHYQESEQLLNNENTSKTTTLMVGDAPLRQTTSFNFLKSKLLFRKLYHPLPYSTLFEKKSLIRSGFLLPYDVKISHLSGCIIVSDSENESLQILDLESCELKCTIKIGHVTRYLAIEMDKRREKEYLYLSVESGFLYKFDLAEMIGDALEGKALRYVWKIGETNDEEYELELPSGIAVSYSNKYKNEKCKMDENAIILLCDTGNNKILTFASSDGSLIETFTTFIPSHLVQEDNDYADEYLHSSLRQPIGICLDQNEDIIMIEHNPSFAPNLHFLYKVGDVLVSKKSLHTQCPSYVMFDPVKRHIFVSEGTSTIAIMDSEGKNVKTVRTFKNDSQVEENFELPDGMCINDKTGELYLVDCEKNQVLIFN
ncbi:predicted protein [Naegleria gruberi]|uniref:Predicted protein n=1 Tax=Naegleria gruberi TaxID=5762 RepID=D2VMN3_NAEGR|nr:uncharacterized protein NAEGRDRAFT_50813 [Naegleria gruberi]EFC41861.1 predicted protein [Naegleria gruberi]|eukprot:XP_002674605.1 predicted protein [Naegleria gruberi strain NEG-M]